jgi:hypothetical protein
MGLSLVISATGDATLGSATQITSTLALYFAGYKPVLEVNRTTTPWTTAFLRSVLPSGLKPEFSGPTTPKMNVAHVDEDGYVIEFQYDEAPVVSTLYLTLYGQTSAADRKLTKICKEKSWKMKYP